MDHPDQNTPMSYLTCGHVVPTRSLKSILVVKVAGNEWWAGCPSCDNTWHVRFEEPGPSGDFEKVPPLEISDDMATPALPPREVRLNCSHVWKFFDTIKNSPIVCACRRTYRVHTGGRPDLNHGYLFEEIQKTESGRLLCDEPPRFYGPSCKKEELHAYALVTDFARTRGGGDGVVAFLYGQSGFDPSRKVHKDYSLEGRTTYYWQYKVEPPEKVETFETMRDQSAVNFPGERPKRWISEFQPAAYAQENFVCGPILRKP